MSPETFKEVVEASPDRQRKVTCDELIEVMKNLRRLSSKSHGKTKTWLDEAASFVELAAREQAWAEKTLINP